MGRTHAAGREAARLRAHARSGRDDPRRGHAARRRLGAARRARGREHDALFRRPDRAMRVAVVGAGVMGCATAWALRERGADVTLFDQFEPGHGRGSSHGHTRIFRLAYPERHWVELADEALVGWRELERQAGKGLLGLYGFVEICSSAEVSSHEALEARLVAHRVCDPSELGLDAPAGWVALVQPEAGVVFADEALAAFRGDLPVERRKVDSLDDVDADVVVVTAGSWVTELVPELPVTVTRETVAYFACEGGRPSVVEVDEVTRRHAMFSLHDPQYGL